MRFVKPSARVLSFTPGAAKLIEQCGRVCYKSERKITSDSAAAFIAMIIKRGHTSVLEHASATILWVCNRGVSHELVRHRVGIGFSQESTRYCDYGKSDKGVAFIEIPDSPVGYMQKAAYGFAEQQYLKMRAAGATPQEARAVLPIGLKTEIAITANFRAWTHLISLRCSKAAHPDIRHLATLSRDALRQICPEVFGALEVAQGEG